MGHGKSVAIRMPLVSKSQATLMSRMAPEVLVEDWWRLKKALKEAKAEIRSLNDSLSIFAPSNIDPEI